VRTTPVAPLNNPLFGQLIPDYDELRERWLSIGVETMQLVDSCSLAPSASLIRSRMVRLICQWQMLQSGQDNDFLHHRCGRRDRCGRKLSGNAFLKDLSGLGLPPSFELTRLRLSEDFQRR
jgi:hypothetical protein